MIKNVTVSGLLWISWELVFTLRFRDVNIHVSVPLLTHQVYVIVFVCVCMCARVPVCVEEEEDCCLNLSLVPSHNEADQKVMSKRGQEYGEGGSFNIPKLTST